jgi:hypothetical protein
MINKPLKTPNFQTITQFHRWTSNVSTILKPKLMFNPYSKQNQNKSLQNNHSSEQLESREKNISNSTLPSSQTMSIQSTKTINILIPTTNYPESSQKSMNPTNTLIPLTNLNSTNKVQDQHIESSEPNVSNLTNYINNELKNMNNSNSGSL